MRRQIVSLGKKKLLGLSIHRLMLLLMVFFCADALRDYQAKHLVRNYTRSLPLGWYLRSNSPDAPDVIFCVAGNPVGSQCPDGAMPLLKPRMRGRVVQLSAAGAQIDGRLLPNTAPKPYGLDGKFLVPYPFGIYPLNGSGVWVWSTYTRDSFDSRYFGPVPLSQVIGYARPFLTW